MTIIKTDQEILDFVRGCTFMGTGGGGDPRVGVAWLKAARDEGIEIALVAPTEIPDEAWTVCPFLMGSIAPLTDEAKQRMQHFGADKRSLQEHSGGIG